MSTDETEYAKCDKCGQEFFEDEVGYTIMCGSCEKIICTHSGLYNL